MRDETMGGARGALLGALRAPQKGDILVGGDTPTIGGPRGDDPPSADPAIAHPHALPRTAGHPWRGQAPGDPRGDDPRIDAGSPLTGDLRGDDL